MVYKVPHFIGGGPLLRSGKSKAIFNPALGEEIGRVDFADKETCDSAVKSAQKAFKPWSDTPPIKRARILFKFRDLLEKNIDELAKIVTREHGKTLEDAKGSVMRGIEVVEHHCGLVTQMQGTYSANVANNIDTFTLKEPLGVCAGVSPFNFPVMVPIWMMIPAIACGNTFILKPSEQNPSAPVRLVELLQEAGLPEGVVNVVHGDKQTVDTLLHNPHIKAFTAVASTPVAQYIYQTATANGKRAHTFGGAKNHCLVMPDANMTFAAKAIASAAYGSAGERCMAISAVVTVGDQTAEKLYEALIPEIKKIKIDAGDAEQVDMGPLISHAHHERLLSDITAGAQEGADLLIDGRNFEHPIHKNGYFLGPCLFDKVDESMSIYQKELFGPILVVIRSNDFQSALELVNRNQYGNGTAIFTQDGYTARQYAQACQVGMVGVNIPIPVPIAAHPFGGWKHSSFGDTGMHSEESIHFYTRRKTVTQRWPQTDIAEHGFSMPTH